MPILKETTSDFDYNVATVPTYVKDPHTGEFIRTGVHANQRQDDGRVVGPIVSHRYGLAQNSDVINIGEAAMRNAGLPMDSVERNVSVYGDGERMRVTWDFRDQTKAVRVEDRKVGDELGLRLSLQNSFNRETKLSLNLGLLRLVCSNGMTALDNEFGLSQKHNSKLNLGAMSSALSRALESFNSGAATEVFHLLASQQVEQEQGLIALQNMVNDKLFSERTRKGIAEIWNAPTFDEDGDRNLHNLYNAGTQYLTHSIAENRRELAEKTSRRLLTTLNTAVRSEANLTTLITPRKTLQVVETVEDSLAI